jgi:hypothetical protein
MFYDYAISVQGLHAAELTLDRSARRIAAGSPLSQATSQTPSQARSPNAPAGTESDSLSLSPVDYAAEAISSKAAEISYTANAKVIAMQRKLERDTLDVLA